jgi:hypothetical protein
LLANAGCARRSGNPDVIVCFPGAASRPEVIAQNRLNAARAQTLHVEPDNGGNTEAAADDLQMAEAAEEDGESEAEMWEIIEETFGRKGELKDGVYRLVTPRTDLFVTMDGMDVPAAAFIESDFRFWRCPCGKLLVNGQFVLADYEVNDVVDELQEGRLEVVAIAPLLLHEHPRLLMVRFQGEGRTRAFAEALKSALSYTGDARNAPQPVDLSPPGE